MKNKNLQWFEGITAFFLKYEYKNTGKIFIFLGLRKGQSVKDRYVIHFQRVLDYIRYTCIPAITASKYEISLSISSLKH